ncbi:hypothetical protein P7228_14230 [Altererythrobacter arenosus]|uniref:DUF2336 domain-containing protein n=1 Tax=Altererythrobacter arenosus TaxID=3032592 RepID=A0ABY8FUP6_9SPHN|nr:hypothetical protein [Altererythrobacter sp. CAU 1644]WFL77131.1 hypothetical protein P7228_14230 [Altererythrobacter sp. CAU 1644]
MSETSADISNATKVEALFRSDLEQGDRALAGVAPVLSYLLANSAQSLITDDLLARMRGMLADISGQLMRIEADAAAPLPPSAQGDAAQDRLIERLASDSTILSHCFAMAAEAQLSEELEQRLGIDQVLTPLMQELIASDDAKTAELAMAAMSAQARFVQARRRMGLSLGDLPADLFDQLCSAWSDIANRSAAATRAKGEAMLRASYDESAGRAALLTRLVGAIGGGAQAALAIEHGGVALFTTALGRLSRQPRELAVLSCHASQSSRLALGLRAAGLSTERVVQQVLQLHPEFAFPANFGELSAERARELLRESRNGAGK